MEKKNFRRFRLTCPLSSIWLLVSFNLSKETTCFIHCAPVAGLSGWTWILGGDTGSAFPATTQLELDAKEMRENLKLLQIKMGKHFASAPNIRNVRGTVVKLSTELPLTCGRRICISYRRAGRSPSWACTRSESRDRRVSPGKWETSSCPPWSLSFPCRGRGTRPRAVSSPVSPRPCSERATSETNCCCRCRRRGNVWENVWEKLDGPTSFFPPLLCRCWFLLLELPNPPEPTESTPFCLFRHFGCTLQKMVWILVRGGKKKKALFKVSFSNRNQFFLPRSDFLNFGAYWKLFGFTSVKNLKVLVAVIIDQNVTSKFWCELEKFPYEMRLLWEIHCNNNCRVTPWRLAENLVSLQVPSSETLAVEARRSALQRSK